MVESPCVKRCEIEPRSGLCFGCRRTLDEIARWGSASETERQLILDAIATRPPIGSPATPG